MEATEVKRSWLVLDAAVRHVAASKLLPSYAREAFEAAHALLVAQQSEIAGMHVELAKLKRCLAVVEDAGAAFNHLTGSGAVLVEKHDEPRRITFTAVDHSGRRGGECYGCPNDTRG